MFNHPETNAQIKGPIHAGRRQPTVCMRCTQARFKEFKAIAARGEDPGVFRQVASMNIVDHNKTVHHG